MKASRLNIKKFDLPTITQALDDMRRTCANGDIPAKLVKSTARQLKLTTSEFAAAAALLNRPFTPSHIR